MENLSQKENYLNDKYTLRFAKKEDDEGIREVYESGSFPGNLEVRFHRDPSPFDSFIADGEEHRMMVIEDNEAKRIIAVGGAVKRQEYVGKEIVTNAYMTGLKIHPDYQKKIFFIAKAYNFLWRGMGECAHCYTTILDDNTSVISMLEKKHRNMPSYKYVGHYTTFFFDGGKRMMKVCEKEVNEDGSIDFENEKEKSEKERIFGFLKKNYSFIPSNENLRGFGKNRWFYATNDDNEIIASCFVGDQKATKQYEVRSYSGALKAASFLPTKLLGYPAFPKPKEIVNHGIISYLYIKDNDGYTCKKFIRTVASLAGYSLYIWGCFENHPLSETFKKMKTIPYGSRLYEVDWEDKLTDKSREDLIDEYGMIGVEVALL